MTTIKLLLRASYMLVVLFLSINSNAQTNLSTSSKRTLHYLGKFQNGKISQNSSRSKDDLNIPVKVQKELGLIKRGETYYVPALIKVTDDIAQSTLTEKGVVISTKAGDIWSVHVPVEELQSFSKLKGIKSIDTGGKMKPLLEKVREETKANRVYTGDYLLRSYYGDSVIVGIIDGGFDYTHPSFWDTVNHKLRISRVWNQLYDHPSVAPPYTLVSIIAIE